MKGDVGRWGEVPYLEQRRRLFSAPKKKRVKFSLFFNLKDIFWELLIIKNKSITNSILDNDGVVLDILDMILIFFHKRASKKI